MSHVILSKTPKNVLLQDMAGPNFKVNENQATIENKIINFLSNLNVQKQKHRYAK